MNVKIGRGLTNVDRQVIRAVYGNHAAEDALSRSAK
jgi:hypothetical protein